MQEERAILTELKFIFRKSLLGVRLDKVEENEGSALYSYKLFLEIPADKFVHSAIYLRGDATIHLKDEEVKQAFLLVARKYRLSCVWDANQTTYTLYKMKSGEGITNEKRSG